MSMRILSAIMAMNSLFVESKNGNLMSKTVIPRKFTVYSIGSLRSFSRLVFTDNITIGN